jgi:hypothetical protein
MKRGDLVTIEPAQYHGKKYYGVVIALHALGRGRVQANVQWDTGETHWWNVKSLDVVVEARNEAR